MTLRLKPPWRRALEGIPTPDLGFLLDPDPGLVEARPRPGPGREKTRRNRSARTDEKRAFNRALAENLVEDDLWGDDAKEGSPNHNQAFDLERLRNRRLQNALAAVIAKLAEDLSGRPIEGDEEWDPEALMERPLTRRPLSRCRRSRERVGLVLIIDTSGSCLPQARFYTHLADAAVRLGDLDLYLAPNAGLIAQKTRSGWRGLADPTWKFCGRTIIFFGDFDGGDAVVEASHKNRVYWFCSEGDRYLSMRQHPWCSYTLASFRGRYFDCLDEEDFLPLLRKVR